MASGNLGRRVADACEYALPATAQQASSPRPTGPRHPDFHDQSPSPAVSSPPSRPRPPCRSSLLALHRTAVLRHDAIGQETLMNLLLRNYLHHNLYDQVGESHGRRKGAA